MPLRKAGRVLIALGALFALYLIVRQLPVVPLVIAGATLLHGMGWPGIFATGAAIYLLTLFMLPIIPLIVACGWLYGPWGGAISLAAAVASAATSFSLARALGGSAAAQALMDRPRAKALAELAAEGGLITVALVRLSPILPYTPSNAVLGLTPMRLRDITLGTAAGMAPGIALYSWAGSLLPSAEAIEHGATLHGSVVWALLAAAFLAAAVLGVAAARRLRRVRPLR
ncbi:MAG TPA: VTT domain-containing protein [Myxococcales bacterium]|jgi:uncharacterized membrane protein YdjX (TVP38/TMEM64 family)|nr:VTT domain-containing protein [Myxococcales bacterium]